MKELIKQIEAAFYVKPDYEKYMENIPFSYNTGLKTAIAIIEAYEPPKDVKEAIEKKWSQDINALMEQHSIGFDQAEALAFEHGIYRRNALFGANLMALQQQKEEWVSVEAVRQKLLDYYGDGNNFFSGTDGYGEYEAMITREHFYEMINELFPAPPSINKQKG